jgi:hypothetical protein
VGVGTKRGDDPLGRPLGEVHVAVPIHSRVTVDPEVALELAEILRSGRGTRETSPVFSGG